MASGNAAELFLLDDGPLPAVASTLTQHEPGQGEQDRVLVLVDDVVPVAPEPDCLPDEVDPSLEPRGGECRLQYANKEEIRESLVGTCSTCTDVPGAQIGRNTNYRDGAEGGNRD